MEDLRIQEVDDKYGKVFRIQINKKFKPLFKKDYTEWVNYDVGNFVRINGESTMFGAFNSIEKAKDYIDNFILKKKTITYHEIKQID